MDQLLKLTNAPFKIEFDGKEYEVRSASLEKVALYMKRLEALQKEGLTTVESSVRLVAYCLLLTLKEHLPDLTEDEIMQKVSGNIDAVDLMIRLGFISPRRATVLPLKTKEENPTSDSSSQPSQPEQAGAQQ